jgi:hypothetical protein
MRSFYQLLLACTLSLAIYGALAQVIRKPLTVDTVDEMIEAKRATAELAAGKRFFILAGSNGRLSHRAEAMEPIMDRPAVNLSIAAGIGPDYLFAKYSGLFRPGDVLYLPFEFGQYMLDKGAAYSGPERMLLLQRDRKLLWSFGWERSIRSYFAFDLSFLIQGAGEMFLKSRGMSRRFGLDTLTKSGDEKGHTRAKGEAYRSFINSIEWKPPSGEKLAAESFGKTVLREFVLNLKSRGVIVIGGLPTTFSDSPPTEEAVNVLRDFYEKDLGVYFVLLENRSTYERDCFFDTGYHLNEECQIEHSKALAAKIREMLRTSVSMGASARE